MIKAVVFDLDDTLISEKEYMIGGFKAVASKISSDFNFDSFMMFLKIKQLSEKSYSNVFNRVLDFYGIKYDLSYINELVKVYRNHDTKVQFYNDIIPIIDELRKRKIKLGIITDGYKETQVNKLNQLNCSALFDSIIITDNFGREYWKPHKLPYIRVSKELGVSYNEMIYIGDNPSKDFSGANELGIKTIQITRINGIYRDNAVKAGYEAKAKIYDMRDLIYHI